MDIIIDTREKARAIRQIVAEFQKQGIGTISSKLWVGDYARIDNQTIVVDRKQNLLELASNICEDRFHREIHRAHEHSVKIVFLCEHGNGIRDLIDVLFWENPRKAESPHCISGEHLYKAMCSMSDKYGVEWEFCTKAETGKRIIDILKGLDNDKRRDQTDHNDE